MMKMTLLQELKILNPWLENPNEPILDLDHYLPRLQAETLLSPDWDSLWLVLTGPRQSGKTTLAKYLCQTWIQQKRFGQLLYLNCDLELVREWLQGISFLQDIDDHLQLKNYILFIDEVQRLENPGLLLKSIIDLKKPIKLLATGSSQLEIRSKVQEFLTGRHLEATIYPFSYSELPTPIVWEDLWRFGAYPQIIQLKQREILLRLLYQTYIEKDIIRILQIQKSQILEKLLGLIAHSSGQLVNYQQLATDCLVTIPTIQYQLNILEKTYIIFKIKPYVGNKRQELTSNPIYYFIDNGFRNQCLNNFSHLDHRTDAGLLFENWVFQELLKFRAQHFQSFSIHYWRTKGGAEVDFVVHTSAENFIPIEVKYKNFDRPTLPRGLRSFISAYQPKQAFIINKNFLHRAQIDACEVRWLPYQMFDLLLNALI